VLGLLLLLLPVPALAASDAGFTAFIASIWPEAQRIDAVKGIGVIAAVYAVAFGSACWPMRVRKAVAAVAE